VKCGSRLERACTAGALRSGGVATKTSAHACGATGPASRGIPNGVGTIVVRTFAFLICFGVVVPMSPIAQAGWFAGKSPAGLGVHDGRLKPCPETPNCVNSRDTGKAAIAPIAYRGSPEAAWQRLTKIVAGLSGSRIVSQSDRYLRVEATSRIFGFVDDVEFLLDADASVIHLRSASRLGYSDLGVNRKRIEQVRARFAHESDPA
jgi:uncharacterized protein (DUF1499 family)